MTESENIVNTPYWFNKHRLDLSGAFDAYTRLFSLLCMAQQINKCYTKKTVLADRFLNQ